MVERDNAFDMAIRYLIIGDIGMTRFYFGGYLRGARFYPKLLLVRFGIYRCLQTCLLLRYANDSPTFISLNPHTLSFNLLY